MSRKEMDMNYEVLRISEYELLTTITLSDDILQVVKDSELSTC